MRAQAADSSLPNPGFETDDNMWSVSGQALLSQEAAHGGKRGLRVGAAEYNTEGSSVTSARLAVTPGQDVTLTFQARSSAPCSGAYLWLYNAAGKAVPAPRGCNTACWVAATNNVWSAYTLKVTIPATIASVAVWVHSSPGAIGFADYDDFTLSGVTPNVSAIPPPPPRKSSPPAAFDPAKLQLRTRPAIIVLKLDDVSQSRGNVPAAWIRVDEALASRNIKASYGVVCETLAEATPEYAGWITSRQTSGRVEFWFHGWNHRAHDVNGKPCNEFAGWSHDEMKALVSKSQKLAQEKLGFTFATFGPTGCGAQGPNLDEIVLQALHDDPSIKVALYPTPLDDMGKRVSDSKLTILDRVWEVNLESLVGVPDCKRLMAGYAANPDRPYFVLQGHPGQWGGERFNEFLRILDFLQSQKAIFMTPSECANALKQPLK